MYTATTPFRHLLSMPRNSQLCRVSVSGMSPDTNWARTAGQSSVDDPVSLFLCPKCRNVSRAASRLVEPLSSHLLSCQQVVGVPQEWESVCCSADCSTVGKPSQHSSWALGGAPQAVQVAQPGVVHRHTANPPLPPLDLNAIVFRKACNVQSRSGGGNRSSSHHI